MELSELLTVPGATAAAIAVAGFAKTIVSGMQARTIRAIAAVSGVAALVVAQIAMGVSGVQELAAAVLSGLMAGLAASKAVEVTRHGLDHNVGR